MIDIDQLVETVEDNRDDSSKYEEALRYLCLTARRYNQIYEELERLKESTGFNKPFPILHLPREIRDQIYTYSLRAANNIDTISHRLVFVTNRDNPSKPPTPGLLRTNKQIYFEAIKVLYLKNTFEFLEPRHLFAFEEQIGFECRNRVREISIWIRCPWPNEVVSDPESLTRLEYDSLQSHWIAALKTCGLGKIVHLGVNVETSPYAMPLSLLRMPKDLQEFIIEFLGRAADDEVPRLSLMGFEEDEREKFPKRWVVVMDQSEMYKEELRGLQMELEEGSSSQWASDVGSFEDEEVVDV